MSMHKHNALQAQHAYKIFELLQQVNCRTEYEICWNVWISHEYMHIIETESDNMIIYCHACIMLTEMNRNYHFDLLRFIFDHFHISFLDILVKLFQTNNVPWIVCYVKSLNDKWLLVMMLLYFLYVCLWNYQ